jgi:hypothetical protein
MDNARVGGISTAVSKRSKRGEETVPGIVGADLESSWQG